MSNGLNHQVRSSYCRSPRAAWRSGSACDVPRTRPRMSVSSTPVRRSAFSTPRWMAALLSKKGVDFPRHKTEQADLVLRHRRYPGVLIDQKVDQIDLDIDDGSSGGNRTSWIARLQALSSPMTGFRIGERVAARPQHVPEESRHSRRRRQKEEDDCAGTPRHAPDPLATRLGGSHAPDRHQRRAEGKESREINASGCKTSVRASQSSVLPQVVRPIPRATRCRPPRFRFVGRQAAGKRAGKLAVAIIDVAAEVDRAVLVDPCRQIGDVDRKWVCPD